MSDVDKLQIAEEAAAQRAEIAAAEVRERAAGELRAEPLRPTALRVRAAVELQLTQVHPGDNVRLDLPEIHELARSIREVGLLTPLLVRPWDESPEADGALPADAAAGVRQYRLVAGHRRHAALVALSDAGVEGFAAVACDVREGLTEAESYALMLTENVQRVPLEPIQAARALRLLLDLNADLDAATLARSLGLRPAWAQTHLKLLDLPSEVQERIEAGDLSVTIADLLRRGQSTGRLDSRQVVDLAEQVASGAITTAQVRREAGPPPRPNTAPPQTVRASDAADEHDAGTWRPLSSASVQGDDFERPLTPLSGQQRENPYASGEALQPTGSTRREAAAALQQSDQPPAMPVIPYEDRLDAYLLGRALEAWASDAYLDELGIDRVQASAYAALLGFEERVAAIRHLSAALMESDASHVSHATSMA